MRLHPSRHQHLPHVALGVLGGMKQQSEHGRRQLLSSDHTWLRKRIRVGRPQLHQCAFDVRVESFQHLFQAASRFRSDALAPESLTLISRKSCTASIGEQPIENTGDVLQVKAHGRHATRLAPETIGRKLSHNFDNLFSSLHKCVSDRLQERRNPFDRSPKPCLVLFSHRTSLLGGQRKGRVQSARPALRTF